MISIFLCPWMRRIEECALEKKNDCTIMRIHKSKRCLWGGIFTMAAVPFPQFIQIFQASYCFESRYLFFAALLIFAIVDESSFILSKKEKNK